MTNRITTEVGTTRSLQLVGRDMAAAAIAAKNQGTVTQVTHGGAEIAAVVPAGPGGALTARDLREAVSALLRRIRAVTFKADATVSDTDVLGVLVARFLDFDGIDIMRAAEAALADANWHEAAANIADIRDQAQAELDGTGSAS